MNGYSVAVLLSLVVCLIMYTYIRLTYISNARSIVQKYPLFAVRDEFIALKMKGSFDGLDDLYVMLCRICNDLIVNTKEVNINLLFRALDRMRRDENQLHEFKTKMSKAPEEVQQATDRMWTAVMDILYANSTTLKTLLFIAGVYTFIKTAPWKLRGSPVLIIDHVYPRVIPENCPAPIRDSGSLKPAKAYQWVLDFKGSTSQSENMVFAHI